MNGISDAEFVEGAFIQEGVSPAEGVVIAACTVGDDDENPENRIGVRRQDGWLEFRLSAEAVVSVDAADDGAAYVLGENGSVVRFDWKSPTREALKASRRVYANPAVADIGPLRRIRIVGADVVCAGSGGQAYRLVEDRFEALPGLVVAGRDTTIEDLAGSSRSDFIAVTSDGHAACFGGEGWTLLDLPVEASLTSICRLDDGDYAIAGKDGTVLAGAPGRWSRVPQADIERSYWGIAADGADIYAAHLAGVDRVTGQGMVALEVEDAGRLEFAVLRSGAEGAWSFAGTTIGRVRDGEWRTIVR